MKRSAYSAWRATVSAAAMIPLTLATWIAVGYRWHLHSLSWAATLVVLAAGVRAAFVPSLAGVPGRVAQRVGCSVAALFFAMYFVTAGAIYVVGGLVRGEPGAVIGGIVIAGIGALPEAVTHATHGSPVAWLVAAVVFSLLALLLLPLFGVGVLLFAPATAAWLAWSARRPRRDAPGVAHGSYAW